MSLLDAFLIERNINPAAAATCFIPNGLAVPHKHYFEGALAISLFQHKDAFVLIALLTESEFVLIIHVSF